MWLTAACDDSETGHAIAMPKSDHAIGYFMGS